MERASLETVADQQVLYLTTIGRATGLPREIEIWFVLQSRSELFRLRRMVVVADDLFEQTSAHREKNPRRVGLDARSGLPERLRMRDPAATAAHDDRPRAELAPQKASRPTLLNFFGDELDIPGHWYRPMLSENQIVADLIGGADADRTRDLLNAIQALSQTELQPHRE